MDAYQAAELAAQNRRQLVEQRESFIFETVFSDPEGEKLGFLKATERAGYVVVLIFIGIESPQISDDRVAMRVLKGGHDVPAQKIFDRFPRTMTNLSKALVELSNVWVIDNSDLGDPFRLVARKENGEAVERFGRMPKWLRPLLPQC